MQKWEIKVEVGVILDGVKTGSTQIRTFEKLEDMNWIMDVLLQDIEKELNLPTDYRNDEEMLDKMAFEIRRI